MVMKLFYGLLPQILLLTHYQASQKYFYNTYSFQAVLLCFAEVTTNSHEEQENLFCSFVLLENLTAKNFLIFFLFSGTSAAQRAI